MTAHQNPLQFWNSSQERKDQFFYTGFCILTTILQDYSDAAILGHDRNSEWSAVASYYGLMHSCRLLLLLAFGDFPKKHRDLPSFMKGDDEVVRANWLKSIIISEDTIEDQILNRSDLLQWAHHTIDPNRDWNQWLGKKGALLAFFLKIRNKLNYEGLLAGHRAFPPLVTHQRVSKVIARIREIGENVIREAVVDSVIILRKFIEVNDVNNRWNSYLNWNSAQHQEATINVDGVQIGRRRIEGIEFLKKLIVADEMLDAQVRYFVQTNIMELMDSSIPEDIALAEDVYNNICEEVFSEKSESFHKLSIDLESLEQAFDM